MQTATEINIISNGSKFYGEEQDTLEQLVKVLRSHKLDIASFGTFGFVEFVSDNGFDKRSYSEHTVSLFGNFLDISHVFKIEGLYKDLAFVICEIEKNIKRQFK